MKILSLSLSVNQCFYITLFIILIINLLSNALYILFKFFSLYYIHRYIKQAEEDWSKMLNKYSKKYSVKLTQKMSTAIADNIMPFIINRLFTPKSNNKGIIFLILKTCPTFKQINTMSYTIYSISNFLGSGIIGTILSLIYNIGKNAYLFTYLLMLNNADDINFTSTMIKLLGMFGGILQTFVITTLTSILIVYLTYRDKDLTYIITSLSKYSIYIENDILIPHKTKLEILKEYNTTYYRPIQRYDLSHITTSVLTNFIFNNMINFCMQFYNRGLNVLNNNILGSVFGNMSSPILILINNLENIINLLLNQSILFNFNLLFVPLTLQQQAFILSIDLIKIHKEMKDNSVTKQSSKLY